MVLPLVPSSPTIASSSPANSSVEKTLAKAMKNKLKPAPKPTLPPGYFLFYAKPVPPCTEPFQLPVGTNSCPVKRCPAFGRVCKPYWRINEHMKMRHGWPRKRTPKLADKNDIVHSANLEESKQNKSSAGAEKYSARIIKKYIPYPSHRKMRKPKSIAVTKKEKPAIVAEKEMSVSPTAQFVPPPKQDRKLALTGVEKIALEEWIYLQIAKIEEYEASNEDNGGPSLRTRRQSLSRTVTTHPQHGSPVDDLMMDEARAHIKWLDTRRQPLHPTQETVRSILAQLVQHRLLRIGQAMPARAAAGMLAVYRLLETYAGDRAAKRPETRSVGTSTEDTEMSDGVPLPEEPSLADVEMSDAVPAREDTIPTDSQMSGTSDESINIPQSAFSDENDLYDV